MNKKEKTIPYFRMVVGLPGSGKSTFLEDYFENSNVHIHSSDSIRKELLGDVNDQSDNSLIFETLHTRIKEDLRNGNSCVYDATNIHEKYRRAFLQELKNIPCKKECYIIATPVEECIKRDEERERSVGKEVINRMYKNFNIPTKREGWDEIYLCYSDGAKGCYNVSELFKRLKEISQNNPHHTLTIGDHCMKTYEIMKEICKRETWITDHQRAVLLTSAMFHDIGKEKTATFINMKGEKTDICHYYGHENVGAYDSLFLDLWKDETEKNDFILSVADMIQLHMKLYSNPESEKYKRKLQNRIGEEKYKLLTLLQEADMSAK